MASRHRSVSHGGQHSLDWGSISSSFISLAGRELREPNWPLVNTPLVAELRTKIKENRAVVITGTGVTANLCGRRAPPQARGWARFVIALGDECQRIFQLDQSWREEVGLATLTHNAPAEDIQKVSQRLLEWHRSMVDKSVASPWELFNHIAWLLFSDLRVEDHRMAEVLDRLGICIMTTNYDTLVDVALRRIPLRLEDLAKRGDGWSQFVDGTGFSRHSRYILHLHGIFYDAEDIVLARSTYQETQHTFLTALSSLIKGKFTDFDREDVRSTSLIFVGASPASMIDLHFRGLWRAMENQAHILPQKHYILVRQQEYDLALKELEPYQRHGRMELCPIIYGFVTPDKSRSVSEGNLTLPPLPPIEGSLSEPDVDVQPDERIPIKNAGDQVNPAFSFPIIQNPMTRKTTKKTTASKASEANHDSDGTEDSALSMETIRRGSMRQATQRANARITAIFTESPMISNKMGKKAVDAGVIRGVGSGKRVGAKLGKAKKATKGNKENEIDTGILEDLVNRPLPQFMGPRSAMESTMPDRRGNDDVDDDAPSDEEDVRNVEMKMADRFVLLLERCDDDVDDFNDYITQTGDRGVKRWLAATGRIPVPIQTTTSREFVEEYDGSFVQIAADLGVNLPGEEWSLSVDK
ncbi:hypothetical protein HDU93_007107 [Gonapodya sp. JEL0774]|nr:hypothetical protein HDU93_007107 [Gonapodya sp. JEL0774]